MATLCGYASRCAVCRDTLGLERPLTQHYRRRFCAGDARECARHAVAGEFGPEKVPDRLMPTDHTEAYEMVSARWLRSTRSPAALVFGAR